MTAISTSSNFRRFAAAAHMFAARFSTPIADKVFLDAFLAENPDPLGAAHSPACETGLQS